MWTGRTCRRKIGPNAGDKRSGPGLVVRQSSEGSAGISRRPSLMWQTLSDYLISIGSRL